MRHKLNIKNLSSHLFRGGLGGVFFLLLSFTINAQNGETIMDNAAAAYQKAGSITASFVMNNSFQDGHNEDFEGTIRMKGDKFVLETPDIKSWFNGNTLWSYSGHIDEVNITSPTGDDLRLTSPAILLSSYKKDFTATYKGEATVNGKKVQKVELTPKTKGNITKVDMQIEKSTGYPLIISVQTKNGATGTIRINQMKTGVNLPDNIFVFNPSDYPDAEIIDLR